MATNDPPEGGPEAPPQPAVDLLPPKPCATTCASGVRGPQWKCHCCWRDHWKTDASSYPTFDWILKWCAEGSLFPRCLESFEFLKVLTEKDPTTMASDFSKRTAANSRIIFGTMRTKRLKALIHWIQDFYRVSCMPTIVGLSETSFNKWITQRLVVIQLPKGAF